MTTKTDPKTDNTPVTVDVDKLPTEILSGAVSAILSEAVENYRWSNRMSRAEVLKEAVTEWATKRELVDGARERLSDPEFKSKG